jgi:hypothetical protein
MPRSRARSRWRLPQDSHFARAWRAPLVSPRFRVANGEDGAPETRARAELGEDAPPGTAVQGAPPDDLAGFYEATHVLFMQAQTKTQIVGFMELQVGSLAVQVPIRAAEPTPTLPLASFEVEGDSYAIFIRGDSSSKAVERAMGEAAKQAMVHLSRKLLN